MDWLDEKKSLLSAGFSEEEVYQEEQRQRAQLFQSGFTTQEIDEYFGVKAFDPTEFKKLVQKNLEDYRAQENSNRKEGDPPREAESFWDAIQAGFQMSVSGLATRGKMPDVTISEDSGMFYRIANQVGTLAGDIPAMIAGGWAGGASGSAVGGAAGTVIPGIGNAAGAIGGGILGAGGGSFALPTAMRKILMDHYEKGDVQSFGDFWERASATFIEASKGFAIGAATAGVGAKVAKVASPLVSAGTNSTLRAGSEIATMVTLGKAIEGDVPEPTDFLEAAIVVGGLHGTTKIASKFRKVYGEFGVKPEIAAIEAERNPVVKQEFHAKNTNFEKINEVIVGEKVKMSKPPMIEPEITSKPIEFTTDFEKNVMTSIGKQSPKAKEAYTFNKFYQEFVDRLNPIKQLEKKLLEVQDGGKVNLSPDEQPYLLSRLAADWKSKLRYVLEKGTIEHSTLAKNGESLQDIVKPHKAELELLDGYMKARGAKDYYKRGLNPGIAEADATAFVSKYKDKFEPTAKRITDWSNRNLQMLRDAGRLTKEEYSIIVEANENYIPFKRLLETDDGVILKPSKEGLLKERTGSDLKTQSPLKSLIENAETTLRLVEKNRATSKLAEVIETYGDESVGKKVAGKGPLKENQFETYRNGEREVWEMADKSVAQAVKALGGDVSSQNIFMKVARGLTLIKKIGISMTPEFIVRNFVRDQLTASVFSNQWHLPVVDTLIAMKDVLGKSEAYYNWMKSGGANGSFLGINESYFKKDILKLNEQTGFLKSTWNIVEKPVDFMKASASLVEEATRLAEFKRVTKGEISGAKVFEGGFAAREVTVDFQRIGAKMASLNAITAFQNVSIQGLDRTLRALKENPKAMSAATGLITTASVAAWFANKDEEWYREIPQWERDLFWHIKGGDVVFRIPKPQELGIMFGSVPERVLEAYVKDNPNAFKEMSDTIGGLITPSFIPDALSTPLEQMVNRNLFTGNPIVNQAAEKLLPAYQFNDYTSETAKALGKLIEHIPYIKDIGPEDAKLASPMVIENYVRGWTGSLGTYTLQAVDQLMIKSGVVKDLKPSPTLSDIPFIKAFVSRYPNANTQSIQDFRDKYKKIESVYATIKQLGEKGNVEEALSLVTVYESEMVRLTSQKEAMSKMHKAIQGISLADIPKDEKRQLIDSVYFQMISVARDGNAMMNEIERAISKRKFNNRLRLP